MKDSLTSIGSFELIVARLKNIARSKTICMLEMPYCALHQKEAEDFIVRDVQKSIEDVSSKKSSNKGGRRGHYAKLRPVLVQVNGMWVVGERPSITQCHAGFIPTEVVTQAASSYMPIHAMSSPSWTQGTRRNLGPI